MRILATSRVYIYIPVTAPADAGDVTQYLGEAALIDDDGSEPAEADWQPADWIGGELALLAGPGGAGAVQYPEGRYFAFARITAGQERPVLPSGRVQIGMGT